MQKHMQYATGKLMEHAEAKLVATVNHRDNFHLWAAGMVFGWMTDSMEVTTKDDNIPIFNILCEECNRVEHDVQYSYSTVSRTSQRMERTWNNHTPTKSKTIRAICDLVYDELNKA